MGIYYMGLRDNFSIHGVATFIFRDDNTGRIVRWKRYKNLWVTTGWNAIMKRLAGDANNCNITWGAVGTGTTAPALSNTTLQTELARIAVATIADTANVLNTLVFFTAAQANGHLYEFGLFGEAASATPDSGTLFCRLACDEVKVATENLTIEHIATGV